MTQLKVGQVTIEKCRIIYKPPVLVGQNVRAKILISDAKSSPDPTKRQALLGLSGIIVRHC